MRQFFEEWRFLLYSSEIDKLQSTSNSVATASDSQDSETVHTKLLLPEIRQPMAAILNFKEFISVSFTHHMEILSKTKDMSERTFYIHQTFINQWDKYALRDILKADLYHQH